jgi:peptide/nickel transport system substrate-binding protein
MTSFTAGHRRRPVFYTLCISLFMVLVMVLLAACGGGGSNNTSSSNKPSVLRVLPAPAQPNPDLFNPYFDNNHGGDWGADGLIFEPLYPTNLYTGQAQKWLADSYAYSNNNTVLTFTMHQGIKWNDGQPLTSQDVVFTFQEMKQYPALDVNGVMPLISSVTAPDNNTVVFTLTRANSTALFYIGGVYIVPQHVWSTVSGDPSKFANDKNPVGTGPYLLKSFSPELITYTRNPNYWGTKPQVQEVQVASTKDNSSADTNMIQGQYDWAGIGWSPDLDSQYKAKDSQNNQDWFAASNTVMLYLNLDKAPFNNLLVRKAISAAINRPQLPQGVALYAKVANPTGIIIPTLNDWISPQYQNMQFTYSASQADSYLQQAGFTKGSDGFYRDSSGKEFTMQIDVVNGWNDWDQDVQFIVNDLKAAGINASMNSESGYTPYFTAISTGNYQAAISWTNSGPNPYFAYQALLSSANSAAPGKAIAGTNFERWDATTSNGYSTQTDKYLADFEASTDQAGQQAAIAGIETIMVNQLPVIPLTVNVYWDEYTTTHWQGWPSASNAYDAGAPYQAPAFEDVILHLTPAS